jgi:hypothetical protein
MKLNKYKLSYLWRINRSQSGFAMPLSLGLGLVMIIVTASTIARSQSDRTTTHVQKETNRALSISEAGAIRVQSFLDRHKLLANQNLDRWLDTLNSLPELQVNCDLIDISIARQQSQVFKNHDWIELDNNDPNKGRYKIIDYRYQVGIGTLTIAGAIDAYNTDGNTSTSILKLQIPIESEIAKIPPPGLWANTFKMSSKQQINGQIRAVSCPQVSNDNPDGVAGIDRTNIAQIDGQLTGEIIADPFTSIPMPKMAPHTAEPIPAITSSIAFPLRASDLPDDNGEYNYLVDIDSPASNHSIKLKDIDTIFLNIAPNRKVNLYLKGDINLGGSQTSNVNLLHPNLKIYGGEKTTKLIIKDNASIAAFIHAPFAEAKNIKSTMPNSTRGITGSIWVKSWDSSTSNGEISIVQAGTWTDFGVDAAAQPPQVNPVSYWARVDN